MIDKEDPVDQPRETPSHEDQVTSMINALSDKVEHLAAAVGGSSSRTQTQSTARAPSDFVKFGKGCLHCGSDKHRAINCPVKKALMEKNGGKLPVGYKSAFDKYKLKQRKPVAPIVEAEDDGEFSETDFEEPVWSMPQCAMTCRMCDDRPSFEHSNPFSAILDEEEDDEALIRDAIQHFSSKVTIGPKLSQKQRKAQRQIDKRSVTQIAKLVREGKLDLPDLELESNSDYEAIWALVDSGAARSCARRKTHFAMTSTHLKPSSVRMATASGEELKSRGCFQLKALIAEGNEVIPTFEDADVDMPIMSVGELSANGTLGSNVLFGEHDGHLIDIKSDALSKFYKRRGLYFMKIFVLKDKKVNRDFTRPGTA